MCVGCPQVHTYTGAEEAETRVKMLLTIPKICRCTPRTTGSNRRLSLASSWLPQQLVITTTEGLSSGEVHPTYRGFTVKLSHLFALELSVQNKVHNSTSQHCLSYFESSIDPNNHCQHTWSIWVSWLHPRKMLLPKLASSNTWTQIMLVLCPSTYSTTVSSPKAKPPRRSFSISPSPHSESLLNPVKLTRFPLIPPCLPSPILGLDLLLWTPSAVMLSTSPHIPLLDTSPQRFSSIDWFSAYALWLWLYLLRNRTLYLVHSSTIMCCHGFQAAQKLFCGFPIRLLSRLLRYMWLKSFGWIGADWWSTISRGEVLCGGNGWQVVWLRGMEVLPGSMLWSSSKRKRKSLREMMDIEIFGRGHIEQFYGTTNFMNWGEKLQKERRAAQHGTMARIWWEHIDSWGRK